MENKQNNEETKTNELNEIEKKDNVNLKDIHENTSKLISNLKMGDKIQDYFVVKFKKPISSYDNNTKYKFELRLGDSSGEIMFKFWGNKDLESITKIYESINKDDIVFITGRVNSWNDKLEISANQDTDVIKVIDNPDDELISRFIQVSSKDINIMYEKLLQYISDIKNKELRDFLNYLFDKIGDDFKKHPASLSRHQNWIGGLLEHSLNVLETALLISQQYKLNKDLIIAGSLIHDIGKIQELELKKTNIAITTKGMLLGHIVLGVELLNKYAYEFNLNSNVKTILNHLIVSSHGKKEFGSPKEPSIPEALIIHYADEIDSKISKLTTLMKVMKTEDDFFYSKDFGNIYIKYLNDDDFKMD